MKLKVIVAHLNHQLRAEESDKDEKFVQEISEKMGFECMTERADIKKLQEEKKLSLEEAGREARYTFFYALKEQFDASYIILAHHRDDNVETVLLNLIRGCGVHGMTGISINTKKILRPLLDFSKDELRKYCEVKKLEYREDATNQDTDIRRNYIRHELIPAIEKINPRFREMLHMKSFYFEEIDNLLTLLALDFIRQHCKLKTSPRSIACSIKSFKKMMPAVQKAVVLVIYELFHGSTQGISSEQIDELLGILERAKTGTEKSLGNRLSLTISYGKAVFEPEREEREGLPDKNIEIPIPGILNYQGGRIITRLRKNIPKKRNKNSIYVAAQNSQIQFFIRKFQPGDRFRPAGMQGTKKVQDFFVDLKIPRANRNRIPILTDQNGNIISIGKLRIDDAYKPKTENEPVLEIEFLE